MADEKRGRGNPRKPDPDYVRKDKDRPDPSKPKCNEPYKHRGLWKRCGKRGFHLKHGPGVG